MDNVKRIGVRAGVSPRRPVASMTKAIMCKRLPSADANSFILALNIGDYWKNTTERL